MQRLNSGLEDTMGTYFWSELQYKLFPPALLLIRPNECQGVET